MRESDRGVAIRLVPPPGVHKVRCTISLSLHLLILLGLKGILWSIVTYMQCVVLFRQNPQEIRCFYEHLGVNFCMVSFPVALARVRTGSREETESSFRRFCSRPQSRQSLNFPKYGIGGLARVPKRWSTWFEHKNEAIMTRMCKGTIAKDTVYVLDKK